ncbi:MAG: tRNA lysidine(34) synthetase TilS [Actinomycetota bacterium]
MVGKNAASTSRSATASPDHASPHFLEIDLDALLTRCTFAPAGTAVECAYSGGPDSTALLILARRAELAVRAHHVDHGLHPRSAEDAEQSVRLAADVGVACTVTRVDVAPGANLEARARAARAAVLPDDALTGHTADDQAETVLLALLRGAGSRGVGAMRPSTTKPLLALRRHETHAVCAAYGLDPIVDPTNDNPRFRRNRVRHEVVPLLNAVAERDMVDLLARTANNARDDDDLLDELATAIDATDAAAVAAAPPPLARRAIRQWLRGDGYPPDAASVERVLQVAAGVHRACEVDGRRIVRRGGRLMLVS